MILEVHDRNQKYGIGFYFDSVYYIVTGYRSFNGVRLCQRTQ